MAAKLSGSSMVISTIICFHIICSDTQLGWQLLPPSKCTIYLYYIPRCSNHIQTIDKLRPSLFLRCLYNYFRRHHCIHHLIYYSSIYRLFPWISKCCFSSLPTCCFHYKCLIFSHLVLYQERYSLPSMRHTTPPLYVLSSSWCLSFWNKY